MGGQCRGENNWNQEKEKHFRGLLILSRYVGFLFEFHFILFYLIVNFVVVFELIECDSIFIYLPFESRFCLFYSISRDTFFTLWANTQILPFEVHCSNNNCARIVWPKRMMMTMMIIMMKTNPLFDCVLTHDILCLRLKRIQKHFWTGRNRQIQFHNKIDDRWYSCGILLITLLLLM